LLILSGIYNSDSSHWQSRWQQEDSRFCKLEHTSWDHPDRHEWVRELDSEIERLGGDLVLVAHSLACLMVTHWAAESKRTISGALLVSVPYPAGSVFPKDAKNFGNFPMKKLPFPSTVVSSGNDPYGSQEHMKRCAQAWGSQFVAVGELGHINVSSNLGMWEHGRELLKALEG
jgi:predicted alpha/beta hydrolase family esterase